MFRDKYFILDNWKLSLQLLCEFLLDVNNFLRVKTIVTEVTKKFNALGQIRIHNNFILIRKINMKIHFYLLFNFDAWYKSNPFAQKHSQ